MSVRIANPETARTPGPERPTRRAVVTSALMSLDTSRDGLSEAQEWLAAECQTDGISVPEAIATSRDDTSREATRLIKQATTLLDKAKLVLWNTPTQREDTS